METINRNAANKAKMFIDLMNNNKQLDAFKKLYSLTVFMEWDNPVETEEINNIREIIAHTTETGRIF